MAHVAQMLTQEPIYKPSSIFCSKPNLISAHKLTLLIYGDNTIIYINWLQSSPKTNTLANLHKSRTEEIIAIQVLSVLVPKMKQRC